MTITKLDKRLDTLEQRYTKLIALLSVIERTGGDVVRVKELLAKTADEFLHMDWIRLQRGKEHATNQQY